MVLRVDTERGDLTLVPLGNAKPNADFCVFFTLVYFACLSKYFTLVHAMFLKVRNVLVSPF